MAPIFQSLGDYYGREGKYKLAKQYMNKMLQIVEKFYQVNRKVCQLIYVPFNRIKQVHM